MGAHQNMAQISLRFSSKLGSFIQTRAKAGVQLLLILKNMFFPLSHTCVKYSILFLNLVFAVSGFFGNNLKLTRKLTKSLIIIR